MEKKRPTVRAGFVIVRFLSRHYQDNFLNSELVHLVSMYYSEIGFELRVEVTPKEM